VVGRSVYFVGSVALCALTYLTVLEFSTLCPDHQPTLTQMIGCRSKKAETILEANQGNEADLCMGNSRPDDAGVLEVDTGSTNADASDMHEEEESIDDHVSEFIAEPEPADQIQRIGWQHGNRCNKFNDQVLQGTSAWGALTVIAEEEDDVHVLSGPADTMCPSAGNKKSFECSWDRLFTEGDTVGDDEDDDDNGMDHLLGLFEGTIIPSMTQIPSTSQADTIDAPQQQSRVDTFMLTQGGQSLASNIEKTITSNNEKLSALEMACPNWRENVSYALFQKDEDQVREALDGVRKSKERMEETKKKILEAWQRQQYALEVFETALNASFDRLATRNNNTKSELEVGSEGHFAKLSPANETHEDGSPSKCGEVNETVPVFEYE
jgi:hypothetical protein